MTVRATITQRMIRDGAPHSECNCAAALALREQLPGRAVEVWSDVIVVDGYEVKPPPVLAAWIDQYDELKAVAPISFELELPEARA